MSYQAIREGLAYAKALIILNGWLRRLFIPVALLPSIDAVLSGGIRWHWWALVSACVLLIALRTFIGGRIDQIHARIDETMRSPEWVSLEPRDDETFAQYVTRFMGRDGE